jgi:LacI family transcriptional regulator, repressor for deo operon, udp, cdd, tsx, nupC, and nupG
LQKIAENLGGVEMAGLREVAALAGVSEATASRALRDLTYVKPETRKAVRDAAKKLSYGPFADFVDDPKSLQAVGVIAPFINRWYFTQALSGAEQALREAGLDLLIYSFSQVKGREKLFREQLRNSRVVGLLIVSVPPTQEEFEALLNLGVPLSFIGISRNGSASAGIDDFEGAKIATQHLINQGHRKIGMIAGSSANQFEFPVPHDRKRGFLSALEESGIEWNPLHEVMGDFTLATGQSAMDELLARRDRPTAIFCQSDEMAIGAIRSAMRHGLKIPDDISIIGFDDHEMAEYFDLTTIGQPVEQIGEIAAWQILDQLKSKKAELKHITLPTQLIVRGSTRKLE